MTLTESDSSTRTASPDGYRVSAAALCMLVGALLAPIILHIASFAGAVVLGMWLHRFTRRQYFRFTGRAGKRWLAAVGDRARRSLLELHSALTAFASLYERILEPVPAYAAAFPVSIEENPFPSTIEITPELAAQVNRMAGQPEGQPSPDDQDPIKIHRARVQRFKDRIQEKRREFDKLESAYAHWLASQAAFAKVGTIAFVIIAAALTAYFIARAH